MLRIPKWGGGGSLSISQPYEPSMIKEFWQGTSDDVKMYVHAHTKPVQREGLPYSTVEAAARVERSELLSRENIKRLSRQERESVWIARQRTSSRGFSRSTWTTLLNAKK